MIGSLVVWLIAYLVDRLFACLIACLVRHLLGSLVAWLFVWSLTWLLGCLVDSLLDCLLTLLFGCLIVCYSRRHHCHPRHQQSSHFAPPCDPICVCRVLPHVLYPSTPLSYYPSSAPPHVHPLSFTKIIINDFN